MTVSELTINENGVIRAPPQVDRVWAAIPIDHPWKGLISSEDEMLLVEAGYPTNFVEPYLELAHMSEDHVKLYWALHCKGCSYSCGSVGRFYLACWR